MKKKAVIKVQVTSDRHRRRALKIAAAAHCVETIALEGIYKDKVVVTGDGFDVVALTTKLKRKLGQASLECLQDLMTQHNATTQFARPPVANPPAFLH